MAHQLSRTIMTGALIVACMAASACGGTAGAASRDKSVQQPTPSIAPYTSSVDKDGDGIDDQSDILQNARAYIATKASITRPATRTTGMACAPTSWAPCAEQATI